MRSTMLILNASMGNVCVYLYYKTYKFILGEDCSVCEHFAAFIYFLTCTTFYASGDKYALFIFTIKTNLLLLCFFCDHQSQN